MNLDFVFLFFSLNCLILFLNSDAPGKHNFDVLKKLVLPDGSILRARLPGRPSRDCLFSDPTRDGVRYEFKDQLMLRNFTNLVVFFSHYIIKTLIFFQLVEDMEHE